MAKVMVMVMVMVMVVVVVVAIAGAEAAPVTGYLYVGTTGQSARPMSFSNRYAL